MIVFVGFMGAGKSTVGRALAERLGVEFSDADARIEEELGRSITEVFEEDGEGFFREVEARVIAEMLNEGCGVIALGGGALEDERTLGGLSGHVVVWLDPSLETMVGRLEREGGRPLYDRSTVAGRLLERRSSYSAVADVRIPGGTLAEQVDLVLKELERRGGAGSEVGTV